MTTTNEGEEIYYYHVFFPQKQNNLEKDMDSWGHTQKKSKMMSSCVALSSVRAKTILMIYYTHRVGFFFLK